MIDEDRIKHIFAVARLMKDNAIKLGLDENEMFTLGLLHDIGYEFGTIDTHNNLGANILKNQNYKYYKEILYHGIPNSPYSSIELDLLNYADMHINKFGDYVDFDTRLKDIGERIGYNSKFYINSKIIAEDLHKKHFLE